MIYCIIAQDPGGEILKAWWSTECLPRIGEQVTLPECAHPGAGDWQELTVIEIYHYPEFVRIGLGGTDGWDAGSVTPLFEAARLYRREHQVAELRRSLGG